MMDIVGAEDVLFNKLEVLSQIKHHTCIKVASAENDGNSKSCVIVILTVLEHPKLWQQCGGNQS